MAQKFGLVVAISEYADPKNNLDGVKNDVPAIMKVLADNGILNVEVIRDRNATLANIQKGLEQLVQRKSAGDVCAFYFSGHGIMLPREFSQTDDADGQDEAFVTYECSLSSLLLDNWMAQFLKASLPKDVSFWGLYDCCHSGDIYKNVSLNGLPPPEENKALAIDQIRIDAMPVSLGKSSDKDLKAVVLDSNLGKSFHFGAAQADKPAICKTINGVRRSVFTWALAETIGPNTTLTINNAERFVAAKVAEETSVHEPQFACNPLERSRVLFT
jgi:hypothetical protein